MARSVLEEQTGVDAAALSLPALLRRASVDLWHALPRTLVAGLVLIAATVPLAVALIVAAPAWLVALAGVPVALALTGLATFSAAVARGERPGIRMLARVDPILTVVLAAAAGLVALSLATPGSWQLVGVVGAAVLLLVAPVALAYGAVRGKRGVAALRGGLILVSFRPSWALTLLAISCLGGFLAAASAGVLLLIAPALVLTSACAVVSALLTHIDGLQERQ
jgi:hypothetical protein